MTNGRPSYADLTKAAGEFLIEFAMLESMYLTVALDGVSNDRVMLDFLPETMDLSKRLKLLRYLAKERDVPAALMKEVETVCNRIDKLSERRNEIAHNPAVMAGGFQRGKGFEGDWTPGVQMAKSKRPKPLMPPKTDSAAFVAWMKSWVYECSEIEQWTRETRLMQNATNRLGAKLNAFKRNDPWEAVKITIPESVGCRLTEE
ncbi:MAG: hypothetical protein WCA14_03695 [Steroidobacteraceae bacterium]